MSLRGTKVLAPARTVRRGNPEHTAKIADLQRRKVEIATPFAALSGPSPSLRYGDMSALATERLARNDNPLERNMSADEFLVQIESYAKGFVVNKPADPAELEEITAFLDKDYAVYLQSTPEDCERIRTSFYGNRYFENFLFGYTRRAVAQLHSTGQDVWLWRGLVSLSLENSDIDYRDTLVGLAELYVNAETHGIEPKPYLQKVASLSSKEQPRGGYISMYKMMTEFDKSTILKERRQMAVGYWDK